MKKNTHSFYKSILVAFAILCFCPFSVFAENQYTIIDLGSLGGGAPADVNNFGQVVGGKYFSGYQSFLWENGEMKDLEKLGGGYNQAYGINNSGLIVGESGYRAVLWENDVVRDLGTLGTLGDPSWDSSGAWGINGSGQIVGWSTFPCQRAGSPTHAFLWENGEMKDLGTLGNDDVEPGYEIASGAEDINDSGQIVGGSQLPYYPFPNPFASHAVIWENGAIYDLGTLGGNRSGAVAINNNGQVIGASGISSEIPWIEHAFIWENGVMADLGTLGGVTSIAYDINDLGQVVGVSSTESGAIAFIWENGTMRDLNSLLPSDSGWFLSKATAINDAGWIVGVGNGNRAFLMKPNVVPEPLSCALFLFGGGALFAGRRLRKKT